MPENVQSKSYKNLIVYQKARLLTIDSIKYFSSVGCNRKHDFLINQTLRSISSIGANIAEGYGRHYRKSYRQFLSIARGSSFETEYWLEVVKELKIFNNEIINSFLETNSELIKMITSMMKNLNRST